MPHCPHVELRLATVPGCEIVLQAFADTAEHMLQTVVDTARLFQQRGEYNQHHGTAILESDLEECDFSQIALVMSIHDFYKPKQSSGHADQGARFLDELVIGLIRHHDKFGIQHTGEASMLALSDVVDWLRHLDAPSQTRALATLPVITLLDCGSLGFLNQARVETYRQLKRNLKLVLDGTRTLDELAHAETPLRIQRLIQSNNRATIGIDFVEDALKEFPRLAKNLPYVRFDAGVYVLEPLMLYLVDRPYDFGAPPSGSGVDLGVEQQPALRRFLGALDGLAEAAVTSGRSVADLGPLSLKPGAGLEARRAEFERWAAGV
ncbi:hypothetical protein [uncultured Paludibaculum sp.]|uniref:hypothetical protein n=1 Tax=uncultured Paludibaculum sp. TaxID=1765020 RepID=UPI002AAC4105|nr:hypothetical protein [uncultured Paludibaculum sp.]